MCVCMYVQEHGTADAAIPTFCFIEREATIDLVGSDRTQTPRPAFVPRALHEGEEGESLVNDFYAVLHIHCRSSRKQPHSTHIVNLWYAI